MRNSNNASGFGLLFTAGTALVSPMHEVITRRPLYGAVSPPYRRSPLLRLADRLAASLERWRQRQEQRKSLAMLNDHLLRDIGLTSEDVREEMKKPFWR